MSSTVYRVVRVIQEVIDVVVPDKEVAKGLESANAYAIKRGNSLLNNPPVDKTTKTLTINAYIKNPYPKEK